MAVVFTDKRSNIFSVEKLSYGTSFIYEDEIYILERQVGDWYRALHVKSAVTTPDPVENYQNFSGECPVEVIELEILFS